MNVFNIPWNDWEDNARQQKETKWVPTITKDFIDHLIPILASIPLKYNENNKISAKATIDALPGTTIETPNGPIAGIAVRSILGFLYLMPRGKLISGSMTKNPRLAAFTPIPMYAQKLHNKISYEKWDKKDPYMKYFLGTALQDLVNIKPSIVLEHEDILRARDKALTYTSGPKMGTKAPLSSYKCNFYAFKFRKFEDQMDDPEDDGETHIIVDYPQCAMMMILQLWLAYAPIRRPGIMILDPWNWDATPKALDSIQEIESVSTGGLAWN